ncbi:hypothetical protein TURU_095834 [Turdus rufiventris]|nr:hypothetical protein TURU_095834 [Turdus rufiventris]
MPCCPVVPRTGAQDQSQALEKVQEGALGSNEWSWDPSDKEQSVGATPTPLGISADPVIQRSQGNRSSPDSTGVDLDSENPVGPFQLRLFFDEGSQGPVCDDSKDARAIGVSYLSLLCDQTNPVTPGNISGIDVGRDFLFEHQPNAES